MTEWSDELEPRDLYLADGTSAERNSPCKCCDYMRRLKSENMHCLLQSEQKVLA